MCGDSAVAVCSGGPGDKWLRTQYINKSLPAPNEYAVRVFVNISYSFMDCPDGRHCEVELRVTHNVTNRIPPYTARGIQPDHHIRNTIVNGTKQFYFDSPVEENGIVIALVSRGMGMCVNVSRVLVYRYECPGNEGQSVGLTRRPATQAAIDTDISVTALCAENSNFSESSISDILWCTTKGTWLNDQTKCECNPGYTKVKDTCSKGKSLSTLSLIFHRILFTL